MDKGPYVVIEPIVNNDPDSDQDPDYNPDQDPDQDPDNGDVDYESEVDNVDDNDNDDDDDNKAIESKKKIPELNLNTDGIDMTHPSYIPLDYSQKIYLRQCEFCQKLFEQKMIVKWEGNTTCYHCYFWTHYNEAIRVSADGNHGAFVAEYIDMCKKDHDYTLCYNGPRSGCCFICDFINGDKLEWIKKRNILFESVNDNICDNDDPESDFEYCVEI